MRILNLSCKNFRNFKSLDLNSSNLNLPTDRNVNVICAPNGMGKTNLLEMLYYLSHIRPFRRVKDRELINDKEKFFFIGTQYKKNGISHTLSISYDGSKEVFLDKKKILSLSSLLGEFLTVLFSNEDISIISGSPSISRRFFDIFFSIIDKEYLHFLKKYQIILKKKNFALKNKQYYNLLPIYDKQITQSILTIQQKRKGYIDKIDKIFQEKFKLIGLFSHKTKIIYSPIIKYDTEETIFSSLEYSRDKDIEYGYATTGLHRDKYLFLLNGSIFSKYASLGQTRLAALVLKSIQSEFYHNKFNSKPILLLDDVILELDPDRKKAFLKDISNDNQMFITITDEKYLKFFEKDDMNVIRIEHGRIQRQ